jgi:hypothetical protein
MLDFRFLTSYATEEDMRAVCKSVGVEFMRCYDISYCAFDVVGGDSKKIREAIDWYRPIGVLVRYFPSHEARLGEFQKRIDAAKANFEAHYGRRSDESSG